MKTKLLPLMLFVASLILFSSCTKDDDALSGSLWVHIYPASNYTPEHTQYIEFTDGSNVKSWDSYWGDKGDGTYTVSGDKITFNDFVYDDDIYVEATYTSKSLTLFYYMNGWTDHMYKKTFIRQ